MRLTAKISDMESRELFVAAQNALSRIHRKNIWAWDGRIEPPPFSNSTKPLTAYLRQWVEEAGLANDYRDVLISNWGFKPGDAMSDSSLADHCQAAIEAVHRKLQIRGTKMPP